MAKRKAIPAPEKTTIKFLFRKPGAFSVEGFGNFWPTMTMTFKQIPGIAGNFAEQGYDFTKEHAVVLDTERPRDLPSDVQDADDDAVRTAYRIRQAEAAANQHEKNNKVRDELQYHESTGLIEIVHDSFMDEDLPEDIPDEVSPDKPKRGRPQKVLAE